MEIKHIAIALSFLSLSACTSATREHISPPLKPAKNISKTIQQVQEKSLKRVVAIGRFSDETKRGNAFLVDKNNNRLGKQASDILSARLTETEKFILLERSDLDLVNQENTQKSSADYMILGSISEYGRTNTSDVGVFSRNKKQKAKVTVNIRLVNTKTKQVVYSEEASGEATSEANRVLGVGETAGYDSTLDDAALSAAISKLTSNVVENLLDSPWQAYLLSEKNGNFFISGGEEQGIKQGDKFDIVTKGELLENPQTGLMIELPGDKVAEVVIASFIGTANNALSIGKLTSGKVDTKKLDAYVVRQASK